MRRKLDPKNLEMRLWEIARTDLRGSTGRIVTLDFFKERYSKREVQILREILGNYFEKGCQIIGFRRKNDKTDFEVRLGYICGGCKETIVGPPRVRIQETSLYLTNIVCCRNCHKAMYEIDTYKKIPDYGVTLEQINEELRRLS